jgi:cation diffusion facilitator CzcD-associated flavoprotein CzcO
VTDTIETFVPEGIRLSSGEVLEADVVVTATGLRLRLFGGIHPTVDGEPVPIPEQFVWRGALLTRLPNFAVCIGYTNASWTLRADLTSRLVCQVLNHLRAKGYDAVVPRLDPKVRPQPIIDLKSGYVQRALGELPHQGDRGVWRVRQNYLWDAAVTLRTDLDSTLEPVRARVDKTLSPTG